MHYVDYIPVIIIGTLALIGFMIISQFVLWAVLAKILKYFSKEAK